MKTKKTILFITGAFVSNNCWDNWVDYFKELGYNAVAPAWPFKNAEPRVLRERQPFDTDLALLTLTEVVDSYAAIAKSFTDKPIIIGHSLGGLIAQILINRDLGWAGVAIHPVPPMEVFPYEFKFLRSTWKVLGLFSSTKKTYLMSFKDFQRTFANEMPIHEQLVAYERHAIPESKTVARGGLTSAARVDFNKVHAPLLITSGSIDNLIPPHLNIRNFNKYKKNGSVTEYKEFADRTHGTLTQMGWQGDADYIARWLQRFEN